MALQWSDSTLAKPKPKPPRPECEKGDSVFVLGWGLPTSRLRDTSEELAILCEVVLWSLRIPSHTYQYFCQVVQPGYPIENATVVVCDAEHIWKPKYQPKTILTVRDMDDHLNGVGIAKNRQVQVELVELKDKKLRYWLNVVGSDKKGKKKPIRFDVEEHKLERMVAAKDWYPPKKEPTQMCDQLNAQLEANMRTAGFF